MSLIEADSEFTAEDRGKYRPADVDGFTADEVEAKIMAALADSDGHDDGRAFRTLPRIKEHAELSKASDISEIIHSMIADKKIRRHENADFTAYFLYDEKPTRYWRNGDGTVGAEFVDEDEPHPFADLIGKPAVPAAYSQPILDQKPYSKQKIEVDPDALEEAMSRHGKQGKAAKELGIGYSTLYSKMSQQPALKLAHDRGLDRYRGGKLNSEKPKKEKTMSTATAPAKAETKQEGNHAPKGIEWSVELFRDAHSRGESTTQLAARLEVSYQSVYEQIKKHPEFKTAFEGVLIEEVENAENEKKPRPKSIIKLKDDVLAQVEECAFNGLSVQKTAEAVGMTYWSLKDNVRGRIKDTSIKEAWERGTLRRKDALNSLGHEIAAGEKVETITEIHDREIAETAATIETSSEDPQRPSSSIVMEIQPDETPDNSGDEPSGTAIEITNNVDERVEANEMTPAFEGPIERFEPIDPFSEPASDKPFHSIRIRNIKADLENPDKQGSFDHPASIMKEIFNVQREAASEFSQTPVSSRWLPFGNGGQLMIGFEGDYFDLSRDERRFLETITEQFEAYGKPTQRKRTTLQRFADWMAKP